MDVGSARRWATTALALSFFTFFGGHVASSGVPYYRDHLITNIPVRHYVRERLLAGELPQWYPYESLGVPLIGQIALGTFHPLNWLFLPFPAPLGEKFALLASYLFALIGAYKLARVLPAPRAASLAAACSYAYGGYALGVSSIIAYAMSVAALPWAAWAGLKLLRRQRLKDAALLGVIWSLVFLAGDAVSFSLFGLVLIGLWLAERPMPLRRTGVLLGLSGAIAALLCCIELLPSMVVAKESVRAIGEPSPTLGLTWATHPLRLPALLISGFVPDSVRSQVAVELLSSSTAFFSTSLFAGALVLVLAVAGLTTRRRTALAFGIVALLGLWLALGDRGGLLPLAKRAVWVLTRFRYPERYMGFFWLGLTPLVALGVTHAGRLSKRWSVALLLGGAGCGLAATLVWAGGGARWAWSLASAPAPAPHVAQAVDAAWSAGLSWAAGFLILGGAALVFASRKPVAAWAVPALVFFELWHGNGNQLPLLEPTLFQNPNPFALAIQATRREPEPLARVAQETEGSFPSTVTGPDRERWVDGMLHLLRSDACGLFGVTSLGTNLGATSVRHALVLGMSRPSALPLAPLLNGCFRIVDGTQPRREGDVELASNGALGLKLMRAPCLPRAFLAATVAAADRDDALNLLRTKGASADFIPWEGGPSLPRSEGSISWLEYRPERVSLDVEVPHGPAALILSDEYAPGWRAHIDGVEAPIYPALLTARGIEVPAGRHRVVFEYRTPSLLWGALASCGGLTLAIALWAFERRKPFGLPPKESPPENT